jgi:hypothetical protein
MHNPSCQIVRLAKKLVCHGRLAYRVVALMAEEFAEEYQGKQGHYWSAY